MDWKVMIPTLLTGGVFFIAFLSLLLVSFNAMLSPLQKDINRLGMDIKANKQEIKANRQEIKANRQELKVIGDKLDQLILVVANLERTVEAISTESSRK